MKSGATRATQIPLKINLFPGSSLYEKKNEFYTSPRPIYGGPGPTAATAAHRTQHDGGDRGRPDLAWCDGNGSRMILLNFCWKK